MTSTAQDLPGVRAYLDELRRLLGAAPDRDLVLEGVVRHIEDALAEGPVDAVRVDAVLDELGDPAAIAAEAAPGVAPARAPFLDRRGGGILIALVVEFGGLVVPVLGWIVGLGLLWSSKGWTVVDKLVATLAPFVLVAVGVGAATAAQRFVHLGLILGLLVYVVAAAVFLLTRFRPAGER